MPIRRQSHTIGLMLSCSAVGCASPTGSAAPSLDIRGAYDVTWSVAYNRPDGNPADPDPSLPRGGCAGTVIIEQQGSTAFRGTITIAGAAVAPCHPGTFPLVVRAERAYAGGDDGYDYGWNLFVQSDVEPLLACTYRSRPPGNSGVERGMGRIDPTGRVSLALGNIYDCPSGRWWIVVGADGQRRRQ